MHKPVCHDLGTLDAYQALQTTPQTIRTVVQGWPAANFEKSYAPGKRARQILIHLAQTERRATGSAWRSASRATRATVQPGRWIAVDGAADALTALDVYLHPPAERRAVRQAPSRQARQEFSHPEYGTLPSPGWPTS